jgi:hypothetical protein
MKNFLSFISKDIYTQDAVHRCISMKVMVKFEGLQFYSVDMKSVHVNGLKAVYYSAEIMIMSDE